MRLMNVKYQDSCIYIELGFKKEEYQRLQSIRNVYVHYKIQIFDQLVQEIYLVKRSDLILLKSRLILIVNVDIVHTPEDCYFMLESLKISFQNNTKLPLKIGTKYLFAEIESYEKPYFTKRQEKQSRKASIVTKDKDKIISRTENQKFKETPLSESGFKILELNKNPQSVLKSVETAIESQIDLEFEQLNSDLRQIYSDTLNLLITNLPKPYNDEELQFNGILINSVRKYMEQELTAIEGE